MAYIPAQQASDISGEERTVRTTYARLSYAVQVEEVHRAIDDSTKDKSTVIDHAGLARRLKNEELTFELSDFKVGNSWDSPTHATIPGSVPTP